jgi:hypothetical protein
MTEYTRHVMVLGCAVPGPIYDAIREFEVTAAEDRERAKYAALDDYGHGYTCDLCDWGRDRHRSIEAYAQHLRREHCTADQPKEADRE